MMYGYGCGCSELVKFSAEQPSNKIQVFLPL